MPDCKDGTGSCIDPEAGGDTGVSEKLSGQILEEDGNLVTWDGPDDPRNPRNWPKRKKWVTIITCECSSSRSMVVHNIRE